MQLTTIPFSGFYNSMHDDALTREIDYFIEKLANYDVPNDTLCRISNLFYCDVNWQKAHKGYAKEYAEAFKTWIADFVELPSLTFESLDSPKFYNYSTDRIFCAISESDAKKLYDYVIHNHASAFESLIADRFTSCDGFVSSYPNHLDDWPDLVKEWDHNQLGILFECLAIAEDLQQVELMEDASGNGALSDLIWDNLPQKTVEYLNAI